RHRHFAFAVRHRLEDAALPEAGFVDQFLRIEDGARPASFAGWTRGSTARAHGPSPPFIATWRIADRTIRSEEKRKMAPERFRFRQPPRCAGAGAAARRRARRL